MSFNYEIRPVGHFRDEKSAAAVLYGGLVFTENKSFSRCMGEFNHNDNDIPLCYQLWLQDQQVLCLDLPSPTAASVECPCCPILQSSWFLAVAHCHFLSYSPTM